MSEPFIGEIRIFGFQFAPRGWAQCNGQLLPIAQNTALFSLLGTTYGGDGRVTFALPDLRSRVPIHQGQGPGLSNYDMGQLAGVESITLLSTEMPQHVHGVLCNSDDANSGVPVNNFPAAFGQSIYATTGNAQMNPGMLTVAGGSQPHSNIQPYLTVNFCIALEGIFPSRN